MDPSDEEDLNKLTKRLSQAQILHTSLQRCTLSRLIEVLHTVRGDVSTVCDDDGRCYSGTFPCEDGRRKIRRLSGHVLFSAQSPLPIVALGLPPLLPPFGRHWHAADPSPKQPAFALSGPSTARASSAVSRQLHGASFRVGL